MSFRLRRNAEGVEGHDEIVRSSQRSRHVCADEDVARMGKIGVWCASARVAIVMVLKCGRRLSVMSMTVPAAEREGITRVRPFAREARCALPAFSIITLTQDRDESIRVHCFTMLDRDAVPTPE
jgi:hypothetical protein